MGKRIQSVLLLGFLAILIAQPALACLAPGQMSQAEMECCKQMSGGCDMNSTSLTSASHPCCKNTVHSDAALLATLNQHVPATLALLASDLPGSGFNAANLLPMIRTDVLGSPPTSPPGVNSILRI